MRTTCCTACQQPCRRTVLCNMPQPFSGAHASSLGVASHAPPAGLSKHPWRGDKLVICSIIAALGQSRARAHRSTAQHNSSTEPAGAFHARLPNALALSGPYAQQVSRHSAAAAASEALPDTSTSGSQTQTAAAQTPAHVAAASPGKAATLRTRPAARKPASPQTPPVPTARSQEAAGKPRELPEKAKRHLEQLKLARLRSQSLQQQAQPSTDPAASPPSPQASPALSTQQQQRQQQAAASTQADVQHAPRKPGDPLEGEQGLGLTLSKGPLKVDRVMYEQLAASRNRLSKKLSAQNQYIRYLEGAVELRDEGLVSFAEAMTKVSTELGTLSCLAESAAAATYYSVDKEDAVEKLIVFTERMEFLREALDQQMIRLDRNVVRTVPVVWFGVASEVRIMGDFDGWTSGVDLSAPDISDQVFTSFESELKLLPGRYQVKFLVDGGWRLAGDWPTVVDENTGETNNLLVVD